MGILVDPDRGLIDLGEKETYKCRSVVGRRRESVVISIISLHY